MLPALLWLLLAARAGRAAPPPLAPAEPGAPPARPPAPGPPRGAVRRLDPTYAGGGRAGYVLYAGGQRFLLDLERDGPRCHYRGTVDGSPRSLAVFNLCGGLDGFFAVGRSRYTVRPARRAPHAEAAARIYGEGPARAPHVFRRESFSFETVPARASCETRDPARPAGGDERRRRRRRSVSRARQVELLLVADASMVRKYGKGLQHYLLTLASIASRLYAHASLENHVRLAVVKVVALGDKEKGLEVNRNAATTLKNFCKWQHQHNRLDDDHEEHYDAAILFTREVGMAPAMGMAVTARDVPRAFGGRAAGSPATLLGFAQWFPPHSWVRLVSRAVQHLRDRHPLPAMAEGLRFVYVPCPVLSPRLGFTSAVLGPHPGGEVGALIVGLSFMSLSFRLCPVCPCEMFNTLCTGGPVGKG